MENARFRGGIFCLIGLIGSFSLVTFVVFTQQAHAALLYLDPAEADIYRGDTLTIALRIDTDEGECINTVDAIIEYGNSIRAVDVSRGDSILNIWLEDPVIDEKNHRITFAGGIPGGYCGRIPGDPRLTNVLAELVFRSPGFNVGGGDEPDSSISISDSSQVLLNDGFGTKANLRTMGAELSLSDKAGTSANDDWSERVADDKISPSEFSIILANDDDAFSGEYFIVFNSQDKQSGIDHYEVMEEPFEDFYLFRWGRLDAPWITAESPYVLKDQSLNSTIRVKAIDKAANETIAILVPEEALRTISRGRIVAVTIIVLSGLIIAVGIGYGLYRRRRRLIDEYEHKDTENI